MKISYIIASLSLTLLMAGCSDSSSSPRPAQNVPATQPEINADEPNNQSEEKTAEEKTTQQAENKSSDTAPDKNQEQAPQTAQAPAKEAANNQQQASQQPPVMGLPPVSTPSTNGKTENGKTEKSPILNGQTTQSAPAATDKPADKPAEKTAEKPADKPKTDSSQQAVVTAPTAPAAPSAPSTAPSIAAAKASFFDLVKENKVQEVQARLNAKQIEGLSERDDKGRIPLHYANSTTMVELLWAQPAVTKITEAERGNHKAEGKAFEAVDSEGRTPIQVMALEGNYKGLKAAVYKVCGFWSYDKLNVKDKNGQTALILATVNNKLNSVIELLNCKRTNTSIVDNEQKTALHYAAAQPDFTIGVELLRSSDSQGRKLRDKDGNIPFDIVTRSKNSFGVQAFESMKFDR